MFSRVARTSLGVLAALLYISSATGPAFAAADPKSIAKCSGAIVKAGAAFVQAQAKIRQKCEESKVKGKPCDTGKRDIALGKTRDKLTSTIVKACQGKDKTCNTVDTDGTQPTLAEINWPTTCPSFGGNCGTIAIADCDDIPTCLACISEGSVTDAIDLYYPAGRAVATDKALNKCQVTIGKAAAAFLGAKSKALAKCWGTKVKKPANCPADATTTIAAAKGKLEASINKACGTQDNAAIGLAANCPSVAPENATACGGSVSSLAQVVTCVGCVTDFEVECPDRASAVSLSASYPPACGIAPPTPTPTATATPSPTATATSVPTVCGDGIAAPSEPCDASAPAANWAQCGPTFTCTNCNCACPTRVTFSGDPADPASILDTGWTGISHRAPIISNGDVTVALTCPGGGTSRPCGTCTVSGPIANPNAGAGQLDNHRCINDTSVRCSSNTDCNGVGGNCEFIFGSNLSLAAGGVTTCVVNQFNGTISGTANVESGEAINSALLTSRVYNGVAIDNPCPRCIGDATINDGLLGGTCDAGPRAGLTCDGNGTVFNRADFGVTSLDCPPNPAGILATLPVDLSNATDPVTRTVTASSPGCSGAPGEKCLCDTCNNANAEPCDANADCPDPAGPINAICGGKRCVGGTNDGAACTGTSECPAAGICGKKGEPTKASACLDDPDTVGVLDCADDGSGEGTCTQGPITQTCSVASGHAQRSCTSDANCDPGGGVGSCQTTNRLCFLTGSSVGKVGTTTLIANGMEDPPMSDTSRPTLGAVFCIGPTSASAVNNVAGLPGPGRVTIKGTAKGLP